MEKLWLVYAYSIFYLHFLSSSLLISSFTSSLHLCSSLSVYSVIVWKAPVGLSTTNSTSCWHDVMRGERILSSRGKGTGVTMGDRQCVRSTARLWIFQHAKTGSCNISLFLPLVTCQKGISRTMVFHLGFVMLQESVRNGDQQPQENETHGQSSQTFSKYDLFQYQG